MKKIIFDIHDTIAYQTKQTKYFINLTYDKILSTYYPSASYSEYSKLWKDLDVRYQNDTKKGYLALKNNQSNFADQYLKEKSYISKFSYILDYLRIKDNYDLSKDLNDCFQSEWIEGLGLNSSIISIIEAFIHDSSFGIVTNFRDARWLRIWLHKSGLDEYFQDNIIISDEIGFRKPHPALFNRIIKKMEITDLSKSIYIGDSELEDRFGAESTGIKCLIIGNEIKSLVDINFYIRQL